MSKSKFLVLAVVVLLKVAAAVEEEENPNYPKIQDEESTQLPGDVNQDELLTISDLTEGKEDKVQANNSTTLNVRRWAPWSSVQPNPAGQGNPLIPSSTASLPQQSVNQKPLSSHPDSWTPASTWMAQGDRLPPSSPSAWMAQAPSPQTWMAQPSSAPTWPNQPDQSASLPPWMLMPAQNSPLSAAWPTQPSSSVPGGAVWMNQPEGGSPPMAWMTQTEKPALQTTWSGQPEKSAPRPTWSDQPDKQVTPSTWGPQPDATGPPATSWGSQPEQPTYNPPASSPAHQTQPQDSNSRLGQPQNQMNPTQSVHSGNDFSQAPTAQEDGKTGAQRPALASGLPDFGGQPTSSVNDPKSFPQMHFYEEDPQQNFSQGISQPSQAQQPSQTYGVPQAIPEKSHPAQSFGADHSSLPGGSQINQTRDDMSQTNMGDLKSMGQQLIDSHNKFGAGLAEFIMKCSDGKDNSQMLKNFGPFYILAGGFPFEGKWTE